PELHGQRSFLPSFSVSSFSPRTILTPRFTCVSEGKPFLRLLVRSKAVLLLHMYFLCHGRALLNRRDWGLCPISPERSNFRQCSPRLAAFRQSQYINLHTEDLLCVSKTKSRSSPARRRGSARRTRAGWRAKARRSRWSIFSIRIRR